MPRRTDVIWVLLFAVASTVLSVGLVAFLPGSATGPRPNIVLIIIDTERQDALSCYGNVRQTPTTPNIDRVAAEGRLFANATSPSPWTAPAVGSMLTGKMPSEHGYHIENLHLRDEETTFVEILSEAGYQTTGFSSNPFVDPERNVTQGFDEFDAIWRERMRDESSFRDEGASRAAERFAAFLDERRDPERPFFALLHFMEPHFPYSPPPPFDARYSAGQDPEVVERVRGWETPFELGYILGENPVTVDEFAALRAQYDGEAAYVDTVIGRIVDDLKGRGLYEDLLLIITSDHGDNIGEHGLMDHKFCVYNTLLRVPLIVRYRRALPSPDRPTRLVQTSDIFHTVLDATRLASRAPPSVAASVLEGGSLLGDGPADRAVYAQHLRPILFIDAVQEHFPGVPTARFLRRLSSVEKDGWKLIHSSDGQHELYDIANDPGETKNLYAARAAQAKALEALLALPE